MKENNVEAIINYWISRDVFYWCNGKLHTKLKTESNVNVESHQHVSWYCSRLPAWRFFNKSHAYCRLMLSSLSMRHFHPHPTPRRRPSTVDIAARLSTRNSCALQPLSNSWRVIIRQPSDLHWNLKTAHVKDGASSVRQTLNIARLGRLRILWSHQAECQNPTSLYKTAILSTPLQLTAHLRTRNAKFYDTYAFRKSGSTHTEVASLVMYGAIKSHRTTRLRRTSFIKYNYPTQFNSVQQNSALNISGRGKYSSS
jgi:hypothetical protein